MTHRSTNFTRRNARTFVVSLLAYAMLTIQFAPMAVAANSTVRRAPAKASDVGRKSSGESREVNQFAPVPGPVPQPSVAVAGPGTSVTATKTDNRTPAQSAAPGDTINYTVVIQNTGAAPATAVVFTDTIDPNTTLVAGSIQSTPVANPDTYNVIGNVRIQPNAAQGLLANDFNPDNGNANGITASGPTTTTQNGNLTVNADGSFSYNPAPGFAGTDTFTYTLTVTATGKTDTGTVTLLVGNGTAAPGTNVIWFVNSGAAVNGDGRLTSPFNCLRGPQCFESTTTGGAADDPGDSIFLYSGNYTGGITLLNNQPLIGAGATVSLASASGVTVQPYSDALPGTSGANPVITTVAAATNGLNIAQNNTLLGFTIGNTTGWKILGSVFSNLTVSDVLLNGTGGDVNLNNGILAATFTGITSTGGAASQGIVLTGVSGSMTATNGTSITNPTAQGILVTGSNANINFGNTTISGGTDGVSFQNNSGGTRTFGTLGVSGGSASAFNHSTGGGNVTVSGAATLASSGNPIEIQGAAAATINFAGGATVTKTTTGGAGVSIGASSVTFESLGITTSNGPGLSAITSGTITVTNGSKAISATGSAGQAAPAIIANAITLNANFSGVSSTNSGNGAAGTGISLTNVAGTSNFGTGSITGATGVSFLVNGGAASVTYNGTITQTTAARVIDIQSKTGGTIALGGAITSNNGTGQGIFLNANGGATMNFTGGMSISTAANSAFTATGAGPAATSGGTINVTQNNTTIVNTLTTTTATALNVANTTIGASGLTVRSITSNGSGTANGIILNNTGATAGLTVTGNGGTCTSAATCTGGTISNKTGADLSTTQGTGIFLNSTSNPSFTRMQLNDFQNYAVRGTSVTGFTLDSSNITGTNGTSSAGGSREGDVAFDGLFTSASFPTAQVTNSTLGGTSFSDGLRVFNTSGTLDRLTVNNVTFGNIGSSGNDSMVTAGFNNGTVMKVTVTNSFFVNAIGSLTRFNVSNNGTLDVVFRQNKLSNNNANQASGGGALSLQTDNVSSPTVTYDISCNRIRDSIGIALLVAANGGGGTTTGSIINNVIGVAGSGTLTGSTQASGIKFYSGGSGTHTIMIANNDVRRTNEGGIFIQNNNGSATVNASVFGNITAEPGPFQFFGLNVDVGALGSDTSKVNVVAGSVGNASQKNDFSNGDPSNFSDVNLSLIGTGQLNLSRNGSAGGTAAQVIDDNNLNPATTNTGVSGTVTLVNTLPATPPVVAGCTVPAMPDPIGEASGASNQVSMQDIASDQLKQPETTVSSSPVIPSVTSQPFISSPRPEAVALVVAPSAQSGVKSGVAQTAATKQKPANKGGKEIAPLVANFPITLGTMQPGKTVTITFSVTVNNPLPPGTTTVSNQGTVSGSNFPSVLTDDPDVAGTNNPTVTNITAPPDIAVRDASAPEPISGTSNMLFIVALAVPAPGPVSVNYATANGGGNPATGGTCAGGADYETTSGTVNFTAGQRIRAVPVVICADATVEPDETLLLNLSAPVGGNIVDGQAVGTITPNVPGTTLISEVRTSGPSGTADDFVEIYNNTFTSLTVAASDASAGYGVFKMGADCNAAPVLVGTIPNGTVIPARGHYLLVGSTYSLGAYAAGNQTLTADIENDSNIGLFTTADVGNLSTVNRLDAVGFGTNTGGAVCDLLREGTTLPLAGGSTSQYSFVKILATGISQDGNDNATDFVIVSTTPGTPVGGNLSPTLGAPGPENVTSPIQRNATIKASLIDTGAVSTAPPNRVRDSTPNVCGGPNCSLGTLTIRRKFTNNTGAAVTRLRFRIVDVTTATAPVGTADLRALTSSDVTVNLTGGGTLLVRGLTLEQPPNQPNGGGLNSSQAAGVVTVGTPIANGASINVQFVLGVQQAGNFRFFINVEALP